MNTGSLLHALKLLFSHCSNSITYYVVAADELPHVVKYEKLPIAIIQNTHPISRKGEHWVAHYIPNKNECEWFDSYGAHISMYPSILTPKIQITRENCNILQGPGSYECGGFCLMFLYSRVIGIDYNRFLNQFSYSGKRNDVIVKKFMSNLPRLDCKNTYFYNGKIQKNKCRGMCPDLMRKMSGK